MGFLSDDFTQHLVNLMMNSFEPLTDDQALLEAELEGRLQNDMTTNDVLASLSRAKYHVMGELIANEYETPDSERMLDEGYTRERAIEHFRE